MYTEMFEKTSSQMAQALNPIREAQGKMLDHFAKIADFQVEAMKHYSELSLGTLRAMAEIKDPQSLQAYVSKQTEVSKSLGEQLTTDMNQLVKINRSFTEDMQKLTQQSVTTASEQAKKAAKEVTDQATNVATRTTTDDPASNASSASSGNGSSKKQRAASS